MVSFWPLRRKDASPASFEKTLSKLWDKINMTQAKLEQVRKRSRAITAVGTLYFGLAYTVYAIIVLVIIGYTHMGPIEWTGLASGPLLIYAFRAGTAILFGFRIDRLNARLEHQKNERTKTIQKLKDATKYESTLQLLEKYGGMENKPKKGAGKKRGGAGGGGLDEEGNAVGGAPCSEKRNVRGRTNMKPPPTANIPRGDTPSHPNTPQFNQSASSPGQFEHPMKPQSTGHAPQQQLSLPRHSPRSDSPHFAPNAFGPGDHQSSPIAAAPLPPTSHWYDRILDSLLGEDETAVKNRVVLRCGNCRQINGQVPPGTRSLVEFGSWKCWACGALNDGAVGEGQNIVRNIVREQKDGNKAGRRGCHSSEGSGEGDNDIEGREDSGSQVDVGSDGPSDEGSPAGRKAADFLFRQRNKKSER